MRFQVPQFLETESKIIGPLTLKQFLYLLPGAIIIFIFNYVFTSLTALIIASLPIAALSFALAFYRVDGIPFPNYLMMSLSFLSGPKKYMYNKEDTPEYLENK
jgi:hypothetical protein